MTRRIRVGLTLVGLLAALAAFAPALAPYDPVDQGIPGAMRNESPSPAHPLGTDVFKRDVLSRLFHGTRVSLLIAALAVVVSVIAGTAVGLVSGFAGGLTDSVIMRLVDAGLAIPRILLLIVVVTLWDGFGITALVAMLGLTSWFGTSRLVRAEVLSLRTHDFITATRALGLSPMRTVTRHVLPNVRAPILVTAILSMGTMVLIETGLSYLGHGVPEPHASLGNMIRDGQSFLWLTPWAVLAPGLIVTVTVLAFSVLGDGIQESADSSAATR